MPFVGPGRPGALPRGILLGTVPTSPAAMPVPLEVLSSKPGLCFSTLTTGRSRRLKFGSPAQAGAARCRSCGANPCGAGRGGAG